MEKTSIQLIKAVATKLRDSKLKGLGSKMITSCLEELQHSLDLENRAEALIFTALFDRSCAGRWSDLDDIASYFGCSQLEIMEYVYSLKSLLKRGMVVQSRSRECQLAHQNFMVSNYVIECILENRKLESRNAQLLEKEFDQYDFCKSVDSQIQDSDMTAESLLQYVESLEHEQAEIRMVKEVTALVPQLSARALFYEVCYDFFERDGEGRSDLNSTLRDMYEAYGVRFRERKALLDGTHPLIQTNLVELTGDKEYIVLTVSGRKLFLGADFEAFGKQYSGLDRYSFAREVTDYIHSSDYDVKNSAVMKCLAEKIRLMEESNRELTCLSKVRELIPEEDFRALFYIACNACLNGSGVSLSGELCTLYPIKERQTNLKSFKERTHKLQQLDLVEVFNKSSLWGEYTALQLTNKGKELYFEEDAELFVEKIDPKELIPASGIKEKNLFFSEAEQVQLSLVENALQEANYQSLVSRLEAKGLSKGIAILLYGAPGTGKTESVLQWARKSGRDVIHVDISSAKSMWYGESEKIVKGIFERYKRLCRRSPLKPILLFNEADAIFSKRRNIANGRSTDQTENTIQNIILEEMETLDGILIATTNLADNLDKAFERRFLFKICFAKPSAETKCRIWLDKLSGLSEAEAGTLAAKFDFSGGEIDNIVRKLTLMEVIEGQVPPFASILQLCEEEKIGRQHTPIGFKR